MSREPSPYLRQHQFNPVDWHAWGQEAFAQARAEGKPIFLSIGYSTCHWCHVMERESFENEAVAAFLNAHFVSIKVDREERPDVDKIYMTFVQATAGQGGWPLTVFLTPALIPVYGGTYFPPADRHGRPGFLAVLQQIHRAWSTRPDDIAASAQDIHRQLALHTQRAHGQGAPLTADLLDQAAAVFKAEYDPRHGGFGGAPKFPRPSQPLFLLRRGAQQPDPEAVQMVRHTCERMAAGGLHDQLGGGFARYAVDERWLVPHFEKMLYDNAQLVGLYLDLYRVSGEERFAGVVRDTLRYVQRDLTHTEGGFYSAEDADSEGKEGKFYCWTQSEMERLLTPEELRVAVRYFGVTEAGNFVDHSDPDPLSHQNVLSVADPRLGPGEDALLGCARQKLLAARAQRIRPHCDDKILASWNGLMLGAFARAYGVLGDPDYLRAARGNFTFLRRALWDAPSGTLYHRWREGQRDTVQWLNAYAFLLGGVIDLYQVTLDAEALEFAVALAESMLRRFYDPEHGGFWQSPADASDLILRVKEDYDGAEPSGNSVAVLGLLQLATITGREDFRAAAERTLHGSAERMARLPQAVPHLLLALDWWSAPALRVVIAGDPRDPSFPDLVRAAHRPYQPRLLVLGIHGPVEPFARTLPARDGRPTAYVCSGNSCQPPTNNPEEVVQLVGGGAR